MTNLIKTFLDERGAWGLPENSFRGLVNLQDLGTSGYMLNTEFCKSNINTFIPHFEAGEGIVAVDFHFDYTDDWDTAYDTYNRLIDYYFETGFGLVNFEVVDCDIDKPNDDLEYEEYCNHEMIATMEGYTSSIIYIEKFESALTEVPQWRVKLVRSCEDYKPWDNAYT